MLGVVSDELARLAVGRSKNDFVFESSRGEMTKAFKVLCKVLNLTPRRLCDTRHSFASIMLSRGEEPAWVGLKMLRHANLTMLFKTYAKYIPREVSKRAAFVNELDLGVEKEPNLFENLA